MTTTSGFTFIHNAIDSGYPIVEAIKAVQPYVDEVVVVDMQSTDNTREVLNKLDVKITNGYWGNEAGKTLRQAHDQYIECAGDMIVHFEADEVYDDSLIKDIVSHVKAGHDSISVMRLKLEQNFQRCRWYPEPVHRVFSRLSNVRKEGHTTNQADSSFLLREKSGYLWDITNCFRDNWFNRVNKQAELRGCEPQYLLTPIHTLHEAIVSESEAYHWLMKGRHWSYTNTPFNIPEILRPLVGYTKYEPRL